MNADGTGQTRLTNAAGVDTYPDWGMAAADDSTPPETTIDSGPAGPTIGYDADLHLPLLRGGLDLRVLDRHRHPEPSAPARARAPPTRRPARSHRVPTPSGCGPPTPPITPISPPPPAASASSRTADRLLLQARRQRRDLLDERRRHRPDPADQQPASDYDPAWSPDGTKIAFTATATATTRST